MKGNERNLLCPCGSGIKAKRRAVAVETNTGHILGGAIP